MGGCGRLCLVLPFWKGSKADKKEESKRGRGEAKERRSWVAGVRGCRRDDSDRKLILKENGWN